MAPVFLRQLVDAPAFVEVLEALDDAAPLRGIMRLTHSGLSLSLQPCRLRSLHSAWQLSAYFVPVYAAKMLPHKSR